MLVTVWLKTAICRGLSYPPGWFDRADRIESSRGDAGMDGHRRGVAVVGAQTLRAYRPHPAAEPCWKLPSVLF